MYRPEQTGRAVRIRPLADVLIGDSVIKESTQGISSMGSATGVTCRPIAFSNDEAGGVFDFKHGHGLGAFHRAAYGIFLTYPNDTIRKTPQNFHYQYTLGVEGDVLRDVSYFPIVAWHLASNPTTTLTTKRYCMLPHSGVVVGYDVGQSEDAHASAHFCVSDHYVEIGKPDWADKENENTGKRSIFFGVCFHNTNVATRTVNNVTVHAHATRFIREVPTFFPNKIR